MVWGARVRWRQVAVGVVGLAAAALAGRVLYDSSDELLTAADTLTSVSVVWVVVAVCSEVLSYVTRGAATAVILRRGGGGAGAITLGATVLAGDAAAYCLPFGFAASGVVTLGVLRRRGVSAAVAGWMFAVCTVLYVAAIAVVTIVAVQIPGNNGPVPGLQSAGTALLAALVLIGGGYALLRRPAARHRIARLTRRLRRAGVPPTRRPSGTARDSGRLGRGLRRVGASIAVRWRDWAAQLRTIRLDAAAGVAAFALMLVCWFTDIAVLALAFLALHSTPPWGGLLLAYCAGQIAASMPVTPGGIGVMEGSITLALVAFGGAQTITLAAVLLYRLIAYWGCIPVGGVAWLVLQATSRAPLPSTADPTTVAVQQATRHPEPTP